MHSLPLPRDSEGLGALPWVEAAFKFLDFVGSGDQAAANAVRQQAAADQRNTYILGGVLVLGAVVLGAVLLRPQK